MLSAPSSVDALAAWIKGAGGHIGPIAVEQHGGYRGLFCTSDGVKAGEPLLAVPRSCTLRGTAGEGLRPIERLVQTLIRTRNDAGEYSSYLETLPERVSLLRDWDGRMLERLGSAAVSDDVKSQAAWLERLCASQEPASRESVEWAERMCRSRGIACTDEDGAAGLQLVPLLDLANHRVHGPEVEPPLLETGDGMTVLCACTALSKGDEVTFEYASDGGNARLLLDYGFAALQERHADDDDAESEEHREEYVGLDALAELLETAPEETRRRLRLGGGEGGGGS